MSTVEQAESGAGLDAQLAAITAAAEARGLTLLDVHTDAGVSGSTVDRPGLAAALDALTSGRAGVLLVAKQDRLSRSLLHLIELLAQADREGWQLAALDTGVDTSTAPGRMLAAITGTIAEYERNLGRARTREALAARRAAGVTLGRPRTVTDDARSRIVALRAEGLSWKAITAAMTAEGWATGQGGTWHPTTVRRLWLTATAAA